MSLLNETPLLLALGLGVAAVNAACLLWLLLSRPTTGGGGAALAGLARSLLAEALGTFALVFVGVLSVTGGVTVGGEPGGALTVALVHGLALAACLAALGRHAPGYFNPAVTLGLVGSGRLSLIQGAAATFGQLGGAAAAAALVAWLCGGETLAAAVPTATMPPRPAFVLEAVATGVLVLVVFGTRLEASAPAAVGAAAAVGMLALGPLTGGVLNPARYLASALAAGRAESWLVYLAGPAVGAVVAGVLMHFVLMPDEAAETSAAAPTEEYRQRKAA